MRHKRIPAALNAAALLVCVGAFAACPGSPGGPSGSSSDPARPIGVPSPDPDLDPLPGFKEPPPGYGEVAFFW